MEFRSIETDAVVWTTMHPLYNPWHCPSFQGAYIAFEGDKIHKHFVVLK